MLPDPDVLRKLEQDYLSGAIDAETYTRLRREFTEGPSQPPPSPGSVEGFSTAALRPLGGRALSDGLRKTAAIILAVFAAFFLYAVFTLPAISTPGPALLAIACVVGAWFLWPRDRSAASIGRPGATDSPEPQPSDSFASELQRLADLHARGALTDDQFEAAKARLLGL